MRDSLAPFLHLVEGSLSITGPSYAPQPNLLDWYALKNVLLEDCCTNFQNQTISAEPTSSRKRIVLSSLCLYFIFTAFWRLSWHPSDPAAQSFCQLALTHRSGSISRSTELHGTQRHLQCTVSSFNSHLQTRSQPSNSSDHVPHNCHHHSSTSSRNASRRLSWNPTP